MGFFLAGIASIFTDGQVLMIAAQVAEHVIGNEEAYSQIMSPKAYSVLWTIASAIGIITRITGLKYNKPVEIQVDPPKE